MLRHPLILMLMAGAALSACTVGPDYRRPAVATPPAFKEAKGWVPASPADGVDKGAWWSAFNDPVLDGLERKVEISNQNLAAAEAAYRETRAMVAADRAQWFPVVAASGSATPPAHPGAFQQVEDQLAAARVLQDKTSTAAEAATDATQNEGITLNEYKAGTVDYTTVAAAQITALNARLLLLSVQAAQMVAAVDLIQALGGGWDATDLPYNSEVSRLSANTRSNPRLGRG